MSKHDRLVSALSPYSPPSLVRCCFSLLTPSSDKNKNVAKSYKVESQGPFFMETFSLVQV